MGLREEEEEDDDNSIARDRVLIPNSSFHSMRSSVRYYI